MSMNSKDVAAAKLTAEESLETPKTRRAFELYYNDGIGRTEEEVAVVLGVTQQTVNNWKTKYKWEERIVQIKQGVYERRSIGKSRDLQDSIDETLGIIATIKTVYKTAMATLPVADAKELKLSDIIRLTDQEIKLLEIKYNYQKIINDTCTRLYKELLAYVDDGDKSVIDINVIREKFSKMLNTSPEARQRALTKLTAMVENEQS